MRLKARAATARTTAARTILFLLSVGTCLAGSGHSQSQTQEPIERFKNIATQLAPEPSTDFHPDTYPSDNVRATEESLRQAMEEALLQALNRQKGDAATIAIGVLEKLKGISDQTLSNWPTTDRFRYHLLDLAPILVVEFGIRSRETFLVVGVPERTAVMANNRWMRVGSDSIAPASLSCFVSVDLFPLRRGPAGMPRFLAKYEHVDCGSGHKLEYAAYDWDSKQTFSTENIRRTLYIKGVMPREDVATAIWTFKSSGTFITLPYCWHSAVDSYAAANLCSVDSYDVSGDEIRFLARRTNKPDLETIARVIEHSQSRNLSAVQGYCIDMRTATSLVQFMPDGFIWAGGSGGLSVTSLGGGKETVAMRLDDGRLIFELTRVQDRWLVSSFEIER